MTGQYESVGESVGGSIGVSRGSVGDQRRASMSCSQHRMSMYGISKGSIGESVGGQ